ncbi:D-amino-acid transaminase [Paenibacillus sp.]|uniref:D-amino-acid transaminase n=1 Tax=Paenibacillus sp. TaxID=58172 RepID=UPI002D633138|nr:D-amino-acid transaminase [Paenibacillus sp.]HZG88011.1 D-amino-acid transaminase [Paenibacillus sp.]
MGTYVWNGERLLPRGEAAADIEDRGYTFGDGIYEVFRVYDGKVFEAEAHWERFVRSAREIRIELPYSAEALDRGVRELVGADGLVDGIVYLQVTRGTAPRAHPFPADAKPVLTAFTKPLARPAAMLESGVSVVTQPDIRWLRCDIKSLNLLPNVLAKQAATEAGAAEAVLHRDGVVTEASASNIAIVKDGVIRTHPANNLILHGITRAVALRLAAELDLSVAERPFTLEELREADEAFLLGTTVEVMPVVRVDGAPIGDGKPGPITRRLQEAFVRLI